MKLRGKGLESGGATTYTMWTFLDPAGQWEFRPGFHPTTARGIVVGEVATEGRELGLSGLVKGGVWLSFEGVSHGTGIPIS
jgi:hypothetical protein